MEGIIAVRCDGIKKPAQGGQTTNRRRSYFSIEPSLPQSVSGLGKNLDFRAFFPHHAHVQQ